MPRFFLLGTLLLAALSAQAETIYFYESYDENSGELSMEASRSFVPLADGGYRVTIEWFDMADSTRGRQSYLLNEQLSTLEWQWVGPGADYSGTRDADVLRLSGVHEDGELEKEHDIDERLFHVVPSVGLQSFALSGEKKIKFASLRPGKLSKHTMKAENEGAETIEWNGEQVETVRVKWGLSGWKSMFFSQTLWFRATDGVLLRTSAGRGVWSQLVREESDASP
jgi:hypothetical protein